MTVKIPPRKAPRRPTYVSARPVLYVDFDRVIHRMDGGPYLSPPVEKAVETLQQLHRKYDIVIFTLRANGDTSYLQSWLREHRIPFDHITDTKGKGIIIDDQAIRFTNWPDVARQLEAL